MNRIDVIQGLRGVSVISVMLFHLMPETFSLGYLGVDVFFVISGFVITKSISDEMAKKNFSFSGFYAKRILRLYPALLFFIISSIFLIFFLTIIDANFKIYLRTAISALIGISNFYLISINNDYFNPIDENPFIHTWSLAVEEQFYLFYPIILVFTLLYFNKKKILFFLLIIITTFFLNFIIEEKNIFTEFYSIFSRFWELLIGCLGFFLIKNNKYKFNKSNYIYLILFLIFLLSYIENIKIKLLIISLTSLLVILNFENKNYMNNFLKNKILLRIGKISYSLYLWHMVIFFIVGFYFVKLEYYFFSIIFSIIIASLSYNLIEKSFTKNKKMINKLKTFFNIEKSKYIISAVILTVIIFFFNIDQIKKFESQSFNILTKLNMHKELKNSNKIEREKFTYICHENIKALNDINNSKQCFFKLNQNNLLIFFGDSHNNSLHSFLKNLDLEGDKISLSFNSSSFLHPIFREDDKKIIKLKKIINEKSKNYKSIYLILSVDHLFSKNLTIDKSNFRNKLISNYQKLLSDLSNNKVVKIILLEDKPSANLTLGQCNTLKKINFSLINRDKQFLCDYSKKIVNDFEPIKILIQNLKKKNNNFYFIKTNSYFCDNDKCHFHNKDSKPFFYDKKHLTYDSAKKYSKFLEKKLKNIIAKKN